MTDPGSVPGTARLFVLLAWHPVLGMAAQPVGVLGVTQGPAPGPGYYVSWIALPADVTRAWRARLTGLPSATQLAAWLAGGGAVQMEEMPAAEGGSLPQVVEGLTDILLAEVIPHMPAYPQTAGPGGA